MTFRVIVTTEAESDLRTIYRYIRRQGAPDAARKWLSGARAQIKTLTVSPERAALAPETRSFSEPIRELFYGAGNRGTIGSYS